MPKSENKLYIIWAGIVALVVGAIFFITSQSSATTDIAPQPQSGSLETAPVDVGENMSGYTGELLAGSYNGVPYLDFNNDDFQKAQAEGKIVYLEFYANWCPTCRAQAQKLDPAFSQVQRDDIVTFRVNYNDPETDDFEKELAQKYNVAYQHHKVIIRGEEVLYSKNEVWDGDDLISVLTSL